MTTTQRLKIGIIGNLLFGNSSLIIMSEFQFSLFILIMCTIMSITCTCVYLLFFNKTQYQKRHPLTLLLFSILCCMLIVFIGSFFISITAGPTEFIWTTSNILSTIGIGIIFGIMGNIRVFPIILLMGCLNWFWFIWMKKYRNIELAHVNQNLKISSVESKIP